MLTTPGPTWSTRCVKSGRPTTICGAGEGDCAVATGSTTAVVAAAVTTTSASARRRLDRTGAGDAAINRYLDAKGKAMGRRTTGVSFLTAVARRGRSPAAGADRDAAGTATTDAHRR